MNLRTQQALARVYVSVDGLPFDAAVREPELAAAMLSEKINELKSRIGMPLCEECGGKAQEKIYAADDPSVDILRACRKCGGLGVVP